MSGLLKACNGGGDAPIDLTENLVAHYLLNNNADDSHGVYDGIPSGGVDFQGDVAEFDGVDDYIDVGSVEFKTISLWVKLDAVRSANSDIILDHATSFDNFRLIRWYDSLNATRFYYGTSYYDLPSPDANVLGMTHLVLTSNGDMYRNGILLHLDTEVCTVHLKHIGASNALSPAYYAKGIITNVRIYSDKKDQAFITALFEEGYYPKPLPLPTTDGLLAHYPLTGTAEDATGNYDGTETSVTYINDTEFGAVSDFNGSGYIETSAHTDTEGAISFWVKRTASTAENYRLWSQANIGGGDIEYISAKLLSTFELQFNYKGYDIFEGSTVLALDEWYHVVVQSDGTSVTAFLNAVSETLTTVAGTNSGQWLGDIANSNHFSINRFYRDTTDDSSGHKQLSTFRVYNRELTTQEITDIYNYEKNFRPIDIDDGLVAHYPLANNSLDNYYNEYDGVDTSMTYDGLSGVFNGTSSYIVTPIQDTLFNSDYSFSVWINRTEDLVDNSIIFDSYNNATAFVTLKFSLAYNNSLLFWHRDVNSVSNLLRSDPLPANTPMMITISKTDSGVDIYIDAILIGTCVSTASGYSDNSTLKLGSRYSSNIELFTGTMAKVRIYNKAITAEQVEVIYNTEKGDFIQ